MKQLTVEEKFAKAVIRLRQIRPFYAALYETLEKVESSLTESVGVTVKSLLYNREYVEEQSFEGFMFDMLHEIAHIALMHIPRMENRDLKIYNIACDLYVNKLLAEEFELECNVLNTKNGLIMKDAMFDPTIDLDKDTVEEIYERLKKQANNQGYESCTDENKVYSVRITDSPASKEIQFKKSDETDLVDNGDTNEKQIDDNRKTVINAKTKAEMLGDKSTDIGTGTSSLEALVDKLLTSRVDWRKLLRKYCVIYKSKDLSFSSPDKRMHYQNAIYPGEYSDETSVLKNVKVCIDTSGSIGEDDLGHFLNQIDQMTKAFKTEAELIEWDTEIECITTIKDRNLGNKKSMNVHGFGGTDPSCLFKYFDSKKCEVKPFVTVIFTDGYIPDINNSKWARKYKNTIWIMTKDYNEYFKAPFGKLAFAKFS